PEPVRQSTMAEGKGPIRSMPRFVTISAARNPDSLHFEGRLPGAKEATMFAEDFATQVKLGIANLKKLPPEAQAAMLAQQLEKIKPVASGNKVTIDMNLSENVLATLTAAVNMLAPLSGSAEVTRPAVRTQVLKK